jgi:SET domain-containing protein
MLIVPNYLAQSALHGLGVFTEVDLKEGQIVSRFMPPFDVHYPPAMLEILSEAEKKYLRHYSYLSLFSEVYILPGDHDRYMNHSDTPNVGMNPDGSTTNLALRNIRAGEELTCDYRTFDADWKLKLPHLCS